MYIPSLVSLLFLWMNSQHFSCPAGTRNEISQLRCKIRMSYWRTYARIRSSMRFPRKVSQLLYQLILPLPIHTTWIPMFMVGGGGGGLHKDFMSCDEAQAYNACFKDTIVHLSALLDARNCIEYFPDYCCCQMISRLKHITYSEAGSMGLYSVQLNYYKLICYVHCLLKVIIYASVDLQI